jgi:exosortase/archaeosortase family protein
MNEIIPVKPKLLKPRKDPSYWVIGFLVISLALFPFVSAFNDLLTNWVIGLKAYSFMSDTVVPQQIKWVVAILNFAGIKAQATKEYIIIPSDDKNLLFELIWNCIGWQSFVMFILTSIIMLSGKFTLFSKIKAIILGIIGTILLNILRISVVITLFSFIGGGVALVFHDYGALITNTMWLIIFWIFVYKFILDEKI